MVRPLNLATIQNVHCGFTWVSNALLFKALPKWRDEWQCKGYDMHHDDTTEHIENAWPMGQVTCDQITPWCWLGQRLSRSGGVVLNISISRLQPWLHVARSLVDSYPRSALRVYAWLCVFMCFKLWTRYGLSWFKDTLECGRVPASKRCGLLMIGNNHENDLISLLDTPKDTTNSQWVLILLIYGPRSEPDL